MRARIVYPALLLLTVALTAVALRPKLERGDDDPEPAGAGGEGSAPSEVGSRGGGGPEPVTNAAGPDASSPVEPERVPSYVRIAPDTKDACPEGMVLVDGVYCPYVGHRCLEFSNEERDVCTRYAPEVLCEGALTHERFCIDRYEYPNLEGVAPVVMVDWNQAVAACEVEGKRLCTTTEWEFACEGTQMWPYPYGLERDAEACNIDREMAQPDLVAFSHPERISGEVARLDRRLPSGSRPRCVSPFGVYDMTGNVDEWVFNPQGTRDEKPYRSTLKGGYWGPIRARCRPITSTHNEWFSFYQVGFRCCRDAMGEAPSAPRRRAPGGWAPLESPERN
jgi:formylglycine-generating enzyme